MMIKIEVRVKSSCSDDVIKALRVLGITDIIRFQGDAFGQEKPSANYLRAADYTTLHLPRVKLELFCDEDRKNDVVTAIQSAAGGSDPINSGNIFVFSVGEFIEIPNKPVAQNRPRLGQRGPG